MGYGDPRTKVKEEKIEGHVVEFSVTDDGSWYASAAILDHSVPGKTIQEARSKVTAQLRRATTKLAVKAHIVNTLPESETQKPWYDRKDNARANLIRPITLRGISLRNHEVMYEFEDSGRRDKKSGHNSHVDPDSIGIVVRRLTSDEQKEYRKRRAAFDEARDSLDAWIKEYKIPALDKFLEEKIQAAIDERPQEPIEASGDPRVDAPLRDTRLDGVKPKRRSRRE